ncbi:Phosphodiest-domain-containing protein [Lophiostoma macrostomum CBS 122681]|uniref:Phosphodiest-domain-containing protein n=1 Tax=Lophiostoma macrostomum CBS 122681 TaxID=1314788 RepID=A0A6A6TWP1_9PLEO|nr:Phosphodiest-domain-containing protein [Lophiostoma macrostomum CBS 122681]
MSAFRGDVVGEVAGSDTLSLDERTLYEHSEGEEDHRYAHGRPSSEVSEGDPDHDILESEDERERLLTEQKGLFRKGVKIGKRDQKKPVTEKMQRRKNSQNEEASALMYEMEEGVGVRSRLWRRLAIYAAIVVLFIVLLSVAYRVSKPKQQGSAAAMLSNGTSLFAPTTILISLDGFRADFLYRGLTPTLNEFIQNGISPKYMKPSFPSVTFPNHYTMATGLYPEAHGVVGNSFWDPSLQKEFFYTDSDRSLQPFWWGGEPLWVTSERQNVRAAVHMWPGSEAHIGNVEPAHIDKYNGSEVLPSKVNRILEWLDLPGPLDVGATADEPRPQLIAAYVPDVDNDGHMYGPNSTEIRKTITSVDTMLGSLLSGLEARNLTNIVNVVVVSDHGMATTDMSRTIQLEDLIDPNELEHIDGWPLYGLRPKNINDLDRLYRQVLDKTKNNPNVEVYLKSNMPERYHFSHNERIAPLWIIPKTGWAIVTKAEYNVEQAKANNEVYHPRGIHGYDHEHPLMRAIFVARGPAFPHKPNSRVEPFQNIELYNIICDSISISPAPNNGTLRLPLKPVGLHTDPETPPNETPADPMASSGAMLATATIPSLSSLAASASGLEDSMSSFPLAEPPVTTTSSAAPAASSGFTEESWWEWLTHKGQNAEEWVEEFLHKHLPGGNDDDDKSP